MWYHMKSSEKNISSLVANAATKQTKHQTKTILTSVSDTPYFFELREHIL